VAERGRTLLQPDKTTQENSLDDRRDENRIAVAAIERHPILGVGPGAPFGRRGLEALSPGRPPVRTEQLWVHNQYLHVLLMGGIAALLPLLAFLAFLFKAVAPGRTGDDRLLALGVGLGTTMLSALVMIYLVNSTAATAVGLLGGAIAVLASGRIVPHSGELWPQLPPARTAPTL
jgi:O-antigen ligase